MKWRRFGFLCLLLFSAASGLRAAEVPCADEVQGRLERERAELREILERHAGGALVDGRLYGLPQWDFDDESNITIRQRQWFHWLNPDMPERGRGPYRYPRWAYDLMNRLDFAGVVVCPDGTMQVPGYEAPLPPKAPIIMPNVNVTNNTVLEGEDYLEIDPTNPRYLVGASNSLTVNGQVVHYSSDYGQTWATVMLQPFRTYHSDPGVNFMTTGAVYSCVVDYTSGLTRVELYKSTDHGATWSTPILVEDASYNDKELATIDNQPASGCKDQIYVCWDDGASQLVSSTTAPYSDVFRPRTTLQSGAWTIGCDIAAGPPAVPGAAAPVYNAWADTKNRTINVSKSTDCGATWSAFVAIPGHAGVPAGQTTMESYDYCIPAQSNRKILIYPSLDVDRSTSPRRGWVYALWSDLSAKRSNCGSTGDPTNSSVWFARSADSGLTWSVPVVVHSDPGATDQFNPWMRVDDADGTIHIGWHDTRNDPNRVKTDFYYSRSTDGGATFLPEIKVTTEMTDESTSTNGHQYGDYEGIAVRNGAAFPYWTDRRPSSGTDEEVFTAKICSDPKITGAVTAVDIDTCARSGIRFSWNAPTIFWGDGGAGTRKYQLWVDGSLTTDNIPETTLATIYSPGDGGPHSGEIRAVNSCGNVSAYTSASATDMQDVTPPDTTGWNSLQAASNGGAVDFSWGAVSGSAGYNAYRDVIPNSPFGPAQRVNGALITGTSYSDTPPAGVVFFYVLKAADSCGNEAH